MLRKGFGANDRIQLGRIAHPGERGMEGWMPQGGSDGQPQTVNLSFSIPVGGGQLHGSARLPAGQTTLTQLLPILQNIENAIIGRVWEEGEQAGKAISCKAGCAACCRQMVPLSLFEAEALAEWVGSLPEAGRAELERRFHAALIRLRDAGALESLVKEDRVLEKEELTELAIEYFRAGVPCPFLDNENCGIYSIRPMACREYLVTSAPELCRDPAENVVSGVLLPLKLSNVLHELGCEIERNRRGWIPLVFLLAWGKSGLKPGDYVAGTGEEVLRRFLDKTAEMVAAQRDEEDAGAREQTDAGSA